MRITIIDGSNKDSQWTSHEKSIEALAHKLSGDHQVSHLKVRDLHLNHCQGCWDCWIKTPGLCRNQDEGHKLLSALADTDHLIYTSPVVAGFISSELKKAMDRSIPTALPYIQLYDGECHHVPRYEIYQNFTLLLYDDPTVDQEALDIIFDNFDRVNKNFRAKGFSKHLFTPDTMEVIYNEISHS